MRGWQTIHMSRSLVYRSLFYTLRRYVQETPLFAVQYLQNNYIWVSFAVPHELLPEIPIHTSKQPCWQSSPCDNLCKSSRNEAIEPGAGVNRPTSTSKELESTKTRNTYINGKTGGRIQTSGSLVFHWDGQMARELWRSKLAWCMVGKGFWLCCPWWIGRSYIVWLVLVRAMTFQIFSVSSSIINQWSTSNQTSY